MQACFSLPQWTRQHVRCCLVPESEQKMPALSLQISGDANVSEFASTNDEDEYVYSVTATGEEDGKQELIQLVQSLKVPVFQRLQAFTQEMQQL